MKKSNKINRAVVLSIAIMMVFTTLIVTANTYHEKEPICLTNTPKADQVSLATISFSNKDVLWDNGDTDGSNGLSNAPQSAFGYRRALLDDFVIPAGETWELTDFHSFNLWDTLQPGSGTDFVLEFWSDAGGVPGSVVATTTTVSYTETATGRTWFSRPEFEIEYIYEPVTLTEGTYWIWGHVDGPENNFWMGIATQTGSECYCDYEDYPPIQPGSNIFGSPFDLSFVLTGTSGGEPGIPDLDCYGTLDFTDVTPGDTVSGTVTVENIGEENSNLDWEIESFPDWGNWTFDPEFGEDLGDGETATVAVDIVAPGEENTEYTGEIVFVNSEDPDDTCIIEVTLKTPVSQSLTFLELLAQRFPILAKILEMLF